MAFSSSTIAILAMPGFPKRPSGHLNALGWLQCMVVRCLQFSRKHFFKNGVCQENQGLAGNMPASDSDADMIRTLESDSLWLLQRSSANQPLVARPIAGSLVGCLPGPYADSSDRILRNSRARHAVLRSTKLIFGTAAGRRQPSVDVPARSLPHQASSAASVRQSHRPQCKGVSDRDFVEAVEAAGGAAMAGAHVGAQQYRAPRGHGGA
jgi:hypothetical protein